MFALKLVAFVLVALAMVPVAKFVWYAFLTKSPRTKFHYDCLGTTRQMEADRRSVGLL